MKIINGGVAAPKGFLASGVHCGIKKKKKDLALIYSEKPAVCAGFFTSNKVKAAPVLLDMQRVHSSEEFYAIIVNSGNANACTGLKGMSDARNMASYTAGLLDVNEQEVLVSSTGRIGELLPMPKIKNGIKEAADALSKDGGNDAAIAIMTTDLVKKEIAVEFKIGKKNVRIAGIAKGVGMIHPGLATMLCFITSDAHITRPALTGALKECIDKTFNMITIDGERSTNDTVLVLANGMAGNNAIIKKSKDYAIFSKALGFVCTSLAKKIIYDGEGATKFIEIKVKGAKTFEDAKDAAFAVAKSSLVKTAMFGQDPNWGRIVSAMGNSKAHFVMEKVDVSLNGVMVLRNGAPIPAARNKARVLLKEQNIDIKVDFKMGKEEATVWTSDLSYGYVKINAAYT